MWGALWFVTAQKLLQLLLTHTSAGPLSASLRLLPVSVMNPCKLTPNNNLIDFF